MNERILLVIENDGTANFLREKLVIDRGYAVSFQTTNAAALAAFKEDTFDVIIIHIGSQSLDSANLIKEFKKIDPDCVLIALMEEDNSVVLEEISRLGIYDFITKPVSPEKLFFLVKKGISLHSLMFADRKKIQSIQEQNIALQKQNALLSRRIEESTKNLTRLYEDLRQTYMRTIKALAKAIDARDHYTHSHSENVAKYAVAISEEMRLPTRDIEMIREACELHDLGKIGVEDTILTKPSGLTPEERKQIERHPVTGAQILEMLPFLNGVADLVRQHHEHYDGSGYPEGMRGEDILLGARIIALADSYEAMRSARSYRITPLSKEQAIAEIRKNNGKQFDPKTVEAFFKIVDKLP